MMAQARTGWKQMQGVLQIPREERPYYLLLGAWVLAMIALPIARWIYGDAAIQPGVIITTLFQFSATFFMLALRWGLRRALLTLLVAAATAWAFEALGTKTGFPYGAYSYTSLLQPQVADVPLLIPFAWFMMLPASWAVASLIVSNRPGLHGRLAFAAVTAIVITAWDLFLDPQMVAWGFWVWAAPGTFSYFGIPWVNFLGWLLTAFVITLLARPANLPVRPLLLMYGITWAFQAIGQIVFWGLPGSGVVGFAGMGSMLLLAWWRTRQTE